MSSMTFRNLPLGFFAVIALSGRVGSTELEDTGRVASARLETRILASLYANTQLRAFDISVFVADREAVLTGTVDDDASRAMVVRLAAGQPGIGSVTDRLIVSDAPSH
jgi:osmotically-inducible protein OsmY